MWNCRFLSLRAPQIAQFTARYPRTTTRYNGPVSLVGFSFGDAAQGRSLLPGCSGSTLEGIPEVTGLTHAPATRSASRAGSAPLHRCAPARSASIRHARADCTCDKGGKHTCTGCDRTAVAGRKSALHRAGSRDGSSAVLALVETYSNHTSVCAQACPA